MFYWIHASSKKPLLCAAIVAMVTLPPFNSESVAQPPTADLSVTKSFSPTSRPFVDSEGNITYTVTVTNNGPSPATNVSLVDTLPDGVSNISGPSCPSGTCGFSPDSRTFTCTFDRIPRGGSRTIAIKVHPFSVTPKRNTATVTATEIDPNTQNNTASVTSTPTEVAITDLEVSLTDSPDPVIAGADLTYAATIHNIGDDDAQNVILTDVLPAGVTFGWATASKMGATCSASAGVVVCSLGTISTNPDPTSPNFNTVTVTIRVTPVRPGFLYNTVGIGLSTPDPNVGNNAATERTWVNPLPPRCLPPPIALGPGGRTNKS